MTLEVKKSKFSIAISVLLVLIAGAYYIKLNLSESLQFKRYSIEYFLLTPAILKRLPVEKIGSIKHYYYSAADGPKPLINILELESGKEQKHLKAVVNNYLLENQFKEVKPGEFKKDSQEITAKFSEANAGTINISIELLDRI